MLNLINDAIIIIFDVQIVSFFSILFIILSTVAITLGTLPSLKTHKIAEVLDNTTSTLAVNILASDLIAITTPNSISLASSSQDDGGLSRHKRGEHPYNYLDSAKQTQMPRGSRAPHQYLDEDAVDNPIINFIETICVAWFSFEYVSRSVKFSFLFLKGFIGLKGLAVN